jgi:hypothetical protein
MRTLVALGVGLLGLSLLAFGGLGVSGLIGGPHYGSLAWSIGGITVAILIGAACFCAAWVELKRPNRHVREAFARDAYLHHMMLKGRKPTSRQHRRKDSGPRPNGGTPPTEPESSPHQQRPER